MDSDVNKCSKDGELFDCICGDEYYKSIDDFQQNINSKVLEYDSEKLSQVILHQNTNDQRLCSRLGTIHILRKRLYSTKLNLTSKIFTKPGYFRQNKRCFFQHYILTKFS